MSNRWRFGGILFQDPRSNICISRRSVLWHLQNVHCSITAHIRTKQVHLGDGEVGVLKSDGSFVFWSLHWAGLWGLGSVGLNEEWGFAMLWACFALRCTLAVRLALGRFFCWVLTFELGCCQGGAALLPGLRGGSALKYSEYPSPCKSLKFEEGQHMRELANLRAP